MVLLYFNGEADPAFPVRYTRDKCMSHNVFAFTFLSQPSIEHLRLTFLFLELSGLPNIPVLLSLVMHLAI